MSVRAIRYADLADVAYRYPSLPSNRGASGPRHGSFMIDGSRYDIVDAANRTATGFQALLLKRKDAGEFIIAMRGTQPAEPADLRADVGMLVRLINDQLDDANRFTVEAKLRLDEWAVRYPAFPTPTLTVTGHSLGGTLAQLMAARHGLRGETFNAYGAAGLLHGVPEGGHQVINHVLATDAVSAASAHFGEVRVYALAEELAVLESPLGGYGGKPGQPGNPLLTAIAVGGAVHGIHLFSRMPRSDGKPDTYTVLQDPQARLRAAQHAEQIQVYRREIARGYEALTPRVAMQGQRELQVRENEDMTLTQTLVGLALATTLASGCSSDQADDIDSYAAKGAYIRSLPEEPKAYRRNPEPQQAYELTVTLENAPGPMVLMGGAAGYEARDCSYLVNRFAGATAQPQDSEEIHFTQVDVATWRGTFFADAILDEDYDGPQGTMLPCRWTLTAANSWFQATGAAEETTYLVSTRFSQSEDYEGEQAVWFTRFAYPRNRIAVAGESYVSSGLSEAPDLPREDVFIARMKVRRQRP